MINILAVSIFANIRGFANLNIRNIRIYVLWFSAHSQSLKMQYKVEATPAVPQEPLI